MSLLLSRLRDLAAHSGLFRISRRLNGIQGLSGSTPLGFTILFSPASADASRLAAGLERRGMMADSAGDPLLRLACMVVVTILLAGCSADAFSRPGRVPSYREPFQNTPANATYQPPNSLPR